MPKWLRVKTAREDHRRAGQAFAPPFYFKSCHLSPVTCHSSIVRPAPGEVIGVGSVSGENLFCLPTLSYKPPNVIGVDDGPQPAALCACTVTDQPGLESAVKYAVSVAPDTVCVDGEGVAEVSPLLVIVI